MSDFTVLNQSLVDFEQSLQDITIQSKKAQEALLQQFELLDQCVKDYPKFYKQYKELKCMISDVRNAMEVYDDIDNEHDSNDEKDNNDDDDNIINKINNNDNESSIESIISCESHLQSCKIMLDELREVRPSFGRSIFVRALLGSVNCKSWKMKERLQMKNEYTKFKYRTNFIFIMFPFIQLFVFAHHFIWTLHQGWLIYFYMTLALRENILLINGSNIKPWWIYHHYVSIAIALVMLAWPIQEVYDKESTKINAFLLLQGFIMWMQHIYQANRSYVRRTLGKAKANDPDSSETLVEKPTDLKILIPLLFILYIFELTFGLYLVVKAFQEVSFAVAAFWGNITVGLGLILLAVGNFSTTASVLWAKRQKSRRLHGDKKNK